MYEGALGFRKKMTIVVLVSSNSRFIHCCRIAIVLNDYLVHSCWGLHLGSRFYKLDALGVPIALLSFALNCG